MINLAVRWQGLDFCNDLGSWDKNPAFKAEAVSLA
jgi:hypothetical protein